MSIIWDIFEVFINFLQGVMASYFIYAFLGSRNCKNYIKSHGLIFALLFSVVVSVFNNLTSFEHFLSFFYVLILFIYSFLSLNGSIPRKIFASIYTVAVLFVSTVIVSSIASNFYDNNISSVLEAKGIERLITVIAAQLVIFYMLYLSLKIIKNEDNLSKTEWFFISITLLFSCIIGILLILASISSENPQSRMYLSLGILSIIIVNVLLIYFTVDLSKKNKEIMNGEINKMKAEYYSQYISNADIEYQMIRKIRHDSNNLHNVVIDLINDGKNEQAIEYLKKMSDSLYNKNIYLKTSNDVVNSVINAKLSLASSLGIDVTCMSVNSFGNVDDIDLCRLLSNMLENAITAVKEINNKKTIHLSISEKDECLYFVMKNSIDHSVILSNPKLKTTKEDKESHGFGTKIITDIAEKYGGKVDFYEKNNMFCTVVIFKKN